MSKIGNWILLFASVVALAGSQSACGPTGNNAPAPATVSATPYPTPSKSITAADVAKLKWLEGTWRGMNGQTPFYERYRLDGTSLIVENFTDGTLSKIDNTGAFELKDGEFGKTEGAIRSAASYITDDTVQFAPAEAGKGNYFRFERQKDGTWKAFLEWPAANGKPPRSKVYVMEPYAASKQP